jgi:hypothetical protein
MLGSFRLGWALIVAGILWNWGLHPVAIAAFLILALPTLIRESRN